jgi:hypothetical protein
MKPPAIGGFFISILLLRLFFSSEALSICIDVNNGKYSSLPTSQGVLRRLVQIETVPLDTSAAHPYRRAVLASRRIQIAI